MLRAAGPAVIADVQDNPGAGASGDTVGMLDACVRRDVDAVVALLADADAARQAHSVGIGGRFAAQLGGRAVGHTPLATDVEVVGLGDGVVTCEGEMMAGTRTSLGPMALLRVGTTNVRVAVTSSRYQCLDLAFLRHLGVTPEDERMIVLKSTVHFRAAFGPIARAVVLAASPGENICRHADIPFRRLHPRTKLQPGGAMFGTCAGGERDGAIPSFEEYKAGIIHVPAPPQRPILVEHASERDGAIPSFEEFKAGVAAGRASQKPQAEAVEHERDLVQFRIRDPNSIEAGWAALGAELERGKQGGADQPPLTNVYSTIEDGWAALGAELDAERVGGA